MRMAAALTVHVTRPSAGTRPWAASQASRAVSSMRALRPRCTTGRRPVQRSRAKVSGLTPSHRCASGRGMSWGGAGSSRGKTNWRADDVAGRVGVWTGQPWPGSHLSGARRAAQGKRAPQTGTAWADTGATALTIYANIIT